MEYLEKRINEHFLEEELKSFSCENCRVENCRINDFFTPSNCKFFLPNYDTLYNKRKYYDDYSKKCAEVWCANKED